MDKIGERLKELRKDKGLTQKQVAQYLNIDRSNYSKYELEKLELNPSMIIKLSELYDVSADYILGNKDY